MLTDDAELAERLRAGDPAGLDDLLERYSSGVFRLARGLTGDAAAAEAVVQDVLVGILRALPTLEPGESLRLRVYRIAVRAALSRAPIRRGSDQVPLEPLLPRFLPDGHRAGDRDTLAWDWSEDGERAGIAGPALAEALDRLPRADQVILFLSNAGDLSPAEIADVLEEPRAAVRARLHRGHLALREQLTARLAATRAPVALPTLTV